MDGVDGPEVRRSGLEKAFWIRTAQKL